MPQRCLRPDPHPHLLRHCVDDFDRPHLHILTRGPRHVAEKCEPPLRRRQIMLPNPIRPSLLCDLLSALPNAPRRELLRDRHRNRPRLIARHPQRIGVSEEPRLPDLDRRFLHLELLARLADRHPRPQRIQHFLPARMRVIPSGRGASHNSSVTKNFLRVRIYAMSTFTIHCGDLPPSSSAPILL